MDWRRHIMKKQLLIILLLCFSICFAFNSAISEIRIIDLNNMTIEELDALSNEIKEAKKAATAIDKKTKKLLEEDFSSILQTIAGEGAKVKFPLLGLDSKRELTCYQVWGDCSAKSDDNEKTDFSGARAIYYYDAANDAYRHVAFLTKESVYFVDSDLLSKISRFLDAETNERLSDFVNTVKESIAPKTTPNTTSNPDNKKASKPNESTSASLITEAPKMTTSPTATPTPTVDPNILYTEIHKGSKGDSVKHLQQRLIELGYLNGNADGVYGNNTKSAVEKFQQRNGLFIDGIASAAVQVTLFADGAISSQVKPFRAYDPKVFSTPTPKPTPTAKPKLTAKPTAKPKSTVKPKPTATQKIIVNSGNSSTYSSGGGSYIGNSKSRVFHRSSCGSVKKMKDSNKVYFSSRDEAISRGYSGCKKCKP